MYNNTDNYYQYIHTPQSNHYYNQYTRLYNNCYNQMGSLSKLDNTKFFTPQYNNITPPISYFIDKSNQGLYVESYTPECKCSNFDITNTKDPKIWGPNLWRYLHYSAINYNPDPETAYKMKEWLKCLSITLPCKNCSKHYSKYLSKFSDDELYAICCNKDELFKLLVDIHNAVNKRNNKKVYTYEEAKQLYQT